LNTKPEIHTIRLHGPWVAKVLAVFGEQAKVGQERRVKIPDHWGDWLGVDFRGQVEYRRSFNRPTGLEPNQLVWLVVEQVDFHAEIFLNDQRLGHLTFGELPQGQPFRIEIGGLLELSNILRLEIQVAPESNRVDRVGLAGGLIGSVRIEIEQ